MLSIKVRGRRRMMLTHGWNAHPDEIVADLQVRRAEWEGRGVPPGTDESERDVRWRNRMRRLGMGAVIAGGAITFLNLGGIRQMGPDERPADLEFQWAVAPTEFQIAMFVLGLLVTAWGAWRWLWFTGTPARPPILATLQERLVFALGGLVQGIGVMMIMDWLNHPR